MTTGTRPENRLARETSPYLLQHARNPVDWYPWGEEALARARSEDKPILLSIGYSACHWCHVMEHESFEDEAVAAVMNAHFVCIKVDREERPDLDDIYMAATIAMTGQGGWPMTVLLLPDQRPFFAGTYFPRETRYGKPGFLDLLSRVVEVWQSDRDGIGAQAERVTQALKARLVGSAPGLFDAAASSRAVAELASDYDAEWGGFGGAPKFPPCPQLRLLGRAYAERADERALAMLRGTLDGMARGGMRDQLGGGFARYSTDARWHVPHFEKMLYDNAQLARVYAEAYALTGELRYEDVCRETLDYLLREMRAPEGAFYSATDADSEGVEGKYFCFTKAELDRLLSSDEARAAAAYFDVRDEGNWEHTNVLWTPRAVPDVARELGLLDAELVSLVASAKQKLLRERAGRVAPGLDDKLLVSWNGLAISALAAAASALDEPAYAEAARRAVGHVRQLLTRPDGGLFRTARGRHAHLDAYLEDYAFFGSSVLDLYEVTGEPELLSAARALCARMVADFFDDESGTFFQTARGHEALIARPRDGHDDALPNACAMAALLCARIGHGREDEALLAIARRSTDAFASAAARIPRAFCSMLEAAELAHLGATSIALVGAEGAARRALTRAIGRAGLPRRVVLHGDGAGTQGEPLLADRPAQGGEATAYVCTAQTCSAPITRAEALEVALIAARRRGAASEA